MLLLNRKSTHCPNDRQARMCSCSMCSFILLQFLFSMRQWIGVFRAQRQKRTLERELPAIENIIAMNRIDVLCTYIEWDERLFSIVFFEEFNVDRNNAMVEKSCMQKNGVILGEYTQMAIGSAGLEDQFQLRKILQKAFFQQFNHILLSDRITNSTRINR